jgi:hypothetical protein
MTRLAAPILSRDISNHAARKPLGKFGAALTKGRIPDLPPVTLVPVRLDPEVWGDLEELK